MKKQFYDIKQPSFKQRETERNRLSKIFVKKYKNPILVHAVDRKESFMKILQQGILKIPKKHDSPKKFLYMEKLLGIDNSIFLSLGFVYYVDYKIKYNLIFDIDLLKESDFYKRPLPFKCYRKIVDYWHAKNKDYLNKVISSSAKVKEVIEHYIEQVEAKAKVRPLRYWEIEKELFDLVMKYPKKNKLKKMSKEMQNELLLKWPYSKRNVRQKYLKNDCPEILYHKNIDLLKHPAFKGFFIEGKIPKQMKEVLEKKYKGRILFDGKRIEVIK